MALSGLAAALAALFLLAAAHAAAAILAAFLPALLGFLFPLRHLDVLLSRLRRSGFRSAACCAVFGATQTSVTL